MCEAVGVRRKARQSGCPEGCISAASIVFCRRSLYCNSDVEVIAMGVFHVPARMRNWQNRFLPPEKQGEEVSCEMLVDSGAAELALPVEVIGPLKLEEAWRSARVYRRWRPTRIPPLRHGRARGSGTGVSGQSHRVAPRRRTSSGRGSARGDGLANRFCREKTGSESPFSGSAAAAHVLTRERKRRWIPSQ